MLQSLYKPLIFYNFFISYIQKTWQVHNTKIYSLLSVVDHTNLILASCRPVIDPFCSNHTYKLNTAFVDLLFQCNDGWMVEYPHILYHTSWYAEWVAGREMLLQLHDECWRSHSCCRKSRGTVGDAHVNSITLCWDTSLAPSWIWTGYLSNLPWVHGHCIWTSHTSLYQTTGEVGRCAVILTGHIM